jgi:leucine dehydrogenase
VERSPINLEHEGLLVRRGPRSGLYCIVAVHSTARGPSLGGCRMWRYHSGADGIADALRLARAMTYKAAVAALPLGGGKGVIVLADGAPRGTARRDVLTDFAETVDAMAGAYVTAEDVGTSSRDMTVIARTTRHVSALPISRGGSGDPSPATALGVQAAILASLERSFASTTLKGRTVAVVGLGHVGLRLARLLARRGARIVAADIDERRRGDAEKLGARWLTPDEALTADVDVLAPCALGGVLNEQTVPRLQAPVIAGAANNQLAHEGVADLLAGRGILWAPDFVANAGGIINISVELEPAGYDAGRARRRVQAIGDTLRAIYDNTGDGVTPLAAALELAGHRLAEPRA